jgi:hypothetical protein
MVPHMNSPAKSSNTISLCDFTDTFVSDQKITFHLDFHSCKNVIFIQLGTKTKKTKSGRVKFSIGLKADIWTPKKLGFKANIGK